MFDGGLVEPPFGGNFIPSLITLHFSTISVLFYRHIVKVPSFLKIDRLNANLISHG
jgi:hypothetical protein